MDEHVDGSIGENVVDHRIGSGRISEIGCAGGEHFPRVVTWYVKSGWFTPHPQAGPPPAIARHPPLPPLARAFPDRGDDLARDILICEQDGDRITHDIIKRINQTFVTPIDREDILELASGLDDIVDLTEEVADYLGLYRIEAPMEQAEAIYRLTALATHLARLP